MNYELWKNHHRTPDKSLGAPIPQQYTLAKGRNSRIISHRLVLVMSLVTCFLRVLKVKLQDPRCSQNMALTTQCVVSWFCRNLFISAPLEPETFDFITPALSNTFLPGGGAHRFVYAPGPTTMKLHDWIPRDVHSCPSVLIFG